MEMTYRARRHLAELRAALRHIRHEKHKAVARMAVGAHFTYYVMVFMEAHGHYGYAAGVCGVILVIEVILGQDKDA